MAICDGLVCFGRGSKRRSTRCSRNGYRTVAGKKHCFLHAERAKADIAIHALRNVSAYAGQLTDEEAEVGIAGEIAGEARRIRTTKRKMVGSTLTPVTMAEGGKSFNRGAVVKRLRLRDGDDCWLCHTRILFLPERRKILGIATIDHVLPVSMGGSNDDENLRLAHLLCNNIRGTSIDADEIRARIATLFDGDGNPQSRARRRQLRARAARQESPAKKDTVYPFCVWPRLAVWPVVDRRGNVAFSAKKPEHLN